MLVGRIRGGCHGFLGFGPAVWSEDFSRVEDSRWIEGVFDALLEHELVVSEFFFQPVSFEQADSVFAGEGAAKFERRKTAHLLPAGSSPAPLNTAAGSAFRISSSSFLLQRCRDGS